MGEYLLRRKAEILGKSVSVASAGLGALVGHKADPLAIEVSSDHQLNLLPHRAQQLTGELVRQHELILVMEAWQVKEIEHLYPYARGRVHLLGKWSELEISDPYKKPKEAFVEAYEKIDRACEDWCHKLW
jgi:protein-tyrosine phosphatase